MCSDTVWKIRLEAARFLMEYNLPLVQVKKGDIKPTSCLVSMERFEKQFLIEIGELIADEELLVRVEISEGIIKLMPLFTEDYVDKQLMPSIIEMLVQVSDHVIEDSTRVRVARIVGPLLEEISRYGFDKKYASNFIEFFEVCIKDKLVILQEAIIHNLPCFLFVYINIPDKFEFFKEIY